MKRATGIGGVFYRCKDPRATIAWYQKHLGIVPDPTGICSVFTWHEGGTSVWGPFKQDTKYFGDSGQAFMLNFRVEDVRALVAVLREEGVTIAGDVEDSEFGAFAWIIDCDGNRVELWQPPAGQ